MNTLVEAVSTIALAVIGLAIVATLVSRNAQTPQVIQSVTSGLANNIAVAQAPVTGVNITPSLAYPSSSAANAFGF